MTLTEKQKAEILELIHEEVKVNNNPDTGKGGAAAVAKTCNINAGALSSILSGTYKAQGDDMLIKIATSLGYDFGSVPWNIAETYGYLETVKALNFTKYEGVMTAIAAPAGSGKTAASTKYWRENKHIGVYKVDCHVWPERPFLLAVAQAIGVELPKGYVNINTLYDAIKRKFAVEARKRPLLIVDQANSLKPSALLSLMYIFNDSENKIGIAALGTENLEYEMKRNVRLIRNGYDELDSRFARTYLHIEPANKEDARLICMANGVTDSGVQAQMFNTLARKTTADSNLKYIPDMRPLVRKIKTTRL